jgi:hypothetical protein
MELVNTKDLMENNTFFNLENCVQNIFVQFQ